MDIFIDNIIFYLQKTGGISVYWAELISRFYNDTDVNISSSYSYDNCDNYHIKSNIKIPFIYKKFHYYHKFVNHKAISSDIFHSSYYRIPFLTNSAITPKPKIITTVHDFIAERTKTGLLRYLHSRFKYNAIRNSDGLICISENTKRDLLFFFPDCERIPTKIIHNGISQSFYKIERHNAELDFISNLNGNDFILYIGSRANYKNFDLVVKLLAEHSRFILIICGGGCINIEEKKFLERTIPNRYFHFNYIETEKLNIFLNFAYAFIYPSRYEGFGIPIIEAMASGCPVLASDTSSIPEISDGACLLAEPNDIEGFSKNLEKLNNINFRNDLINKGLKRAKSFSWDKCYRETLSFYKEITKTL